MFHFDGNNFKLFFYEKITDLIRMLRDKSFARLIEFKI